MIFPDSYLTLFPSSYFFHSYSFLPPSDILQQDTLFTRKMGDQAFQEVCWGPTMNTLANAAPATLCLLLALLGVDAAKS